MHSDQSSSVAFPLSESPVKAQPQPRPTHLPFRRISLPTAPTLGHRESVVSVASFDSLPEDGSLPIPAMMRNVNAGKRPNGRPISTDGLRKGNRRSLRPVDDVLESKRRKVIQEFYETERAYVDGLELIYSHFLTPIIASLETSQPLLDRFGLTSVFSNFIDIWNFHRSFFSALTSHLFPSSGSASTSSLPLSANQPLSPILLSHFPYLSLYTPFVTAFPTTISSITNLISPPSANSSNPQYSASFATFLATQESDPRCGRLKLRDWLLTIVQRCPRYLLLLKDLIERTAPDDPEHAQLTAVHTLVSKITQSLNSSLHTHAQTLSLLALQKTTPNLPFQLISPGRTLLKRGSLLQIERSEPPREREFLLFSDCLIWLASEDSERGWMKTDWAIPGWAPQEPASPLRPLMIRTRSKSEAELPSLLRSRINGSPVKSRSVIPPPTRKSQLPGSGVRRQASSGDERWVYKARAGLVDLEVVVTSPREAGEERRFEVLSPEGSFVLYADTEDERNEWCSTIRQAKAQLLMSLNITNPNSTLTSSSSTNHIRLSLQALPFAPSDHPSKSPSKGKKKSVKERRGWVDHWVPAIWIPDEKAEGCMRCGRSFGWRRRRHHCRICGRCVCAACSNRTFFITDPNSKEDTSKPARACNACYETVFPLLDPPEEEEKNHVPPEASNNTITSLTNFPSWLSMPSLPLSATPEALMAIYRDTPKRGDTTTTVDDDELSRDCVRVKSPASRPRSYYQILEDFQGHDHSRFDLTPPVEEEGTTEEDSLDTESFASSKRHTVNLTEEPEPRREDTARRNKRFSLPAVALQTTSVTTRTMVGAVEGSKLAHVQRSTKTQRFSLVLGGKGSHVLHGHGSRLSHSQRSEFVAKSRVQGDEGLGKGVAAGKLSELLGKKVYT
ncbi:hypothetical protein ARMGADRAFT_481939 [Armillaria gallica]|uniref:Dbl homology domain-containing protein n=1 Tax=Armillaria gallica TaxID=47427 RepID=A0A2H3DYB0_ARMGA|nr:hypothetical protein ARMGADRAFT_481939 [Armillaria gallica]